MTLMTGLCRPHTFSNEAEISPTVHRAREASIESSNKFALPSFAARVRALSAAVTRLLSLSALIFVIFSICPARTALLSIANASTLFSPESVATSYLLTPIMTS